MSMAVLGDELLISHTRRQYRKVIALFYHSFVCFNGQFFQLIAAAQLYRVVESLTHAKGFAQ